MAALRDRGLCCLELIRLTCYIVVATQQPAIVKYPRHISFATSFRTEKGTFCDQDRMRENTDRSTSGQSMII
jgi:hypothetical protein